MPNIRIHTFPALLTAFSLTDSKLIAHPIKPMLMRNFSITNLEQSKRLYFAGLKLSTADYIIQYSISKVSGVVDVEETPIKVERPSDLQKAEDNDSFSAAWSLGKLIYMMPDSIPSAYDEYENTMPDEFAVFNLVMGQNSVKYVADGSRCRLRANGSCLLDAVVEMVEMLLKEEYFDYSEDKE